MILTPNNVALTNSAFEVRNMKRNNMFMLAYIIFIFISLVVRFFFDYEMWAPIISAITIASCMFAVSDIFCAVANIYSDDAKTFVPMLDGALQKVERIEATYNTNEPDITRCKEMGSSLAGVLSEFPIMVDKTKRELNNIKKTVNRKMNVAKVCNSLVNPLTVIGFLSFFCTITFEPINNLMVSIQDLLTVFAFGIILVTQYFSNYSKEQHEELEVHYNEANSVLEDLDKTLASGCETLGRAIAVDKVI